MRKKVRAAASNRLEFCEVILNHLMWCIQSLVTDVNQHIKSVLTFMIMGLSPIMVLLLGRKTQLNTCCHFSFPQLKDEVVFLS
ncbi:serine/threonine-protein phosphatase 2A 65 kDa regulatory subunit A alpha isoform-like [Dysidea avara]|uniref:serine/threonine-protein phosphatase 2A 65 kDa regulatory subunit A alpha isoform-like n=1 Tax=Dysidea avara TaxID=196820 RepID=UPI00332445F1